MQNYIFNNSQYLKRINKPKKFIFTILISLIIILTFIFSHIKTNSQTVNFYFIQVEKFSNYKDALNFKIETEKESKKTLFIYFDNYYFLLHSFHTNYKITTEELKKFPNKNNVKILTISASKFSSKKTLTSDQNLYIKNALKTLQNLNNLTSEFATKERSQILEKVEYFTSIIKDIIKNFYTTFKSDTKFNEIVKILTKIKNFLQEILSSNIENFPNAFQYSFINIAMQEIQIYNLFWFLFFIISTSWKIPSPIRKIANAFLRISFLTLTAINEPTKLNTEPITAKPQVDFASTSLFLKWINNATKLIGKNANRLTPWAWSCW